MTKTPKFLFIFLSMVLLGFLLGNMLRIKIKVNEIAEIKLPEEKLNADLKKLQIRGSVPYWDQESAVDSFKAHASNLNQISLFWYFLTDEGNVQKYEYAKEDTSIIKFAHANGIKVSAVITNLPEDKGTTWDSKRVEKVLENNSLQRKHIVEIVKKVKDLNFDGVTIDYEEVVNEQRDNFSRFISELAQALHQEGKFIGVALHPQDGANKKYLFQDWNSLSQSADQLYIMAYGEHWDTGGSGPIASYPWVKKIVAYPLKLKLANEKIFLGIPVYGYDWNKDNDDRAKGLTFVQVQDIMKKFKTTEKWDEGAKSPYFTYADTDGEDHEVWFENSQSVTEKIKLASSAGLGGVTFWRLGGEDDGIWEYLRENRK